ncbi:RadC family protein [Cytophaga hutchinsonii]|jgi:DNA repair protein RadC|uniref:DNA replication and repair protein RadC n=1 Tax=Cytophaga hutchinsonii (strain ATCC 33406 / DSM 1761 / CIP 103989 / NBRC 15051 / NCIMB 9469 / D465) TaxID=269798 RepID=A0A6N4SQ47_CYTH3|nr:DNA repair protein RadC [Cytophaga hutchinsonii]ABG58428.1 DNA replication and repair protein RadC [Cytophaga hutchinsonii ATCC 33406]SFX50389.1 DNA replication and repair protein RadC [Cytophaga hutchinsonii ATCC 33406]
MENYILPASKILSWAEEDRPREKLLLKGISALSDAELIAILLGSGTTNVSAVELAKQIMQDNNQSLNNLARQNVKALQKFKGIGEAKAITLVSALELGRRRKVADVEIRPQVKSSEDVYNYMQSNLADLPYEEFWILLLNRANRIEKKIRISTGGVSGTVADPKLIYKYALENLASSIILVHNHPSGNTKPSEADYSLTKKLCEAGTFLETPVLDHVIICNHTWYSFADEGKI